MHAQTAAPTTVMARATDLHKVYDATFPPVRAVAGVSACFLAGQFTAVMGPSGSGKSTLVHLLAGLDRPTAGAVEVDGQDLALLDDDALTALRRRRLGFVFQAYNLVPTLSAVENIRLPLSFERRPGPPPDPEWERHLVTSLGLATALDHRPDQLSGGQQQRVAIARALLLRPAVVLADEPTGNLDIASGAQVLTLLRELATVSGTSVLMVTHDPVAASRADRILFLGDGLLVRETQALAPHEVAAAMLALRSDA